MIEENNKNENDIIDEKINIFRFIYLILGLRYDKNEQWKLMLKINDKYINTRVIRKRKTYYHKNV